MERSLSHFVDNSCSWIRCQVWSAKVPSTCLRTTTATVDRLAQLESTLTEVRQHSFPVSSDIIESTRAEIEELRKTVEYRRVEDGTYDRVEELNDLRRMLEQNER